MASDQQNQKNSQRNMLLSEYFLRNKQVPLQVLERYRNLVKALCSQDQKTEEEELFINDFFSCICDIKVPAATPSTATDTPTQTEPGESQNREPTAEPKPSKSPTSAPSADQGRSANYKN